MSFSATGICMDAKLWATLALDDMLTAQTLFEKGHLRNCLFHCHFAMEKILKAILAAKGQLTEKDDVHSLQVLAKKLDYDDEKNMPKKFFLHLVEASSWHIDVSYPLDTYRYETLNNFSEVKIKYNKTHEVFVWLTKELADAVKEGNNNEEIS